MSTTLGSEALLAHQPILSAFCLQSGHCQLRQKGASVPAVRSRAGQASMALVDYEVQRLQRIANNRRRMEEMGIFAVRAISIAIA